MKSFLKILLSGVIALSIVACTSSQTGGSLPQAQDPNSLPGTDLPATPDQTDNSIPKWINTAASLLPNGGGTTFTNFTGLQDILGVVYPPLVGNPFVKVAYNDTRSVYPSGMFYLAFEDDKGLATFADNGGVQSVDGTGVHTSTNFDMIFWSYDSFHPGQGFEGAIRVFGPINSSGVFAGKVLYRLRQAGDTACEKVQTCNYNPNTGQWDICSTSTRNVAGCQQYMQETAAGVQVLGTFNANISQWVTQ